MLLLLAALASPDVRPVPPAPSAMEKFVATSGATARATVSIRIVSGVAFGPGRQVNVEGATQRSVRLEESPGVARPAQLLEFQ